MLPFLRVDVHRVGVAHDEDGALGAVAAQSRDEVGALRILRKDFHLDALGLQHALEVIDHRLFAARRIAGVEADQRLEMFQRFKIDGRPVDRGGVGGAEGRAE